MTALHTCLLIAADSDQVLLEHRLEQVDWFLAGREAVFEAVVLDDIAHRPRLSIDESPRVWDVIRELRRLLLAIQIDA